jgi:hypothetical protein
VGALGDAVPPHPASKPIPTKSTHGFVIIAADVTLANQLSPNQIIALISFRDGVPAGLRIAQRSPSARPLHNGNKLKRDAALLEQPGRP